MIKRTNDVRKGWAGRLARLRRDRAGNTLAMMAVALVPLSAMAGSAVDMSRLYVVKVRLQQACDAGALAGRKFMAEDGASSLDGAAKAQAENFFENNFPEGWMSTKAVDFKPKKTKDKQVEATASATVPMTIMKMFAAPDVKLDVTCEARYDVPDVDVMFVLDTTGSMACAASETSGCSQPTATYTRADGTTGYYVTEKSTSKIKALRSAVFEFYDTVDESSDPFTNVRYGIVPYSSAVNVGYDLPAGSLVSEWSYQSRRAVGDSNSGSASTDYPSGNQTQCNNYAGRNPGSGYDGNGQAKVITTSWNGSATNKCTRTTQTVIPIWRYAQWPMDVSQYILGNAVTDPSKAAPTTSRWAGCVEERDTTATTSFSPSALPPDLDPDLPATSDATRWRPMYGEQIYYRSSPGSFDSTGNAPNLGGEATYLQAGYGTCPKRVRRLSKMTRTALDGYINASDFRPLGGTYHDVGMIWGARMISPTGPFASDTAAWPDRPSPRRHIVFMTDGDMAPNADIYGQYAHERIDRRVSGGDLGSLTERHNARFLAACTAAKARNITLWVVAFGSALTDELKACATTPSQAFFAADDETLEAQFKSIARQVAMLRVSK